MEEEVPGNGGWAKDGEAEEPTRVAGESAAGRKGTRRSEKAKVSEEALSTRSSKAKKPMNACVHTYTKSQTPSTRRLGPGWRIHGSVEDTKLNTNKQHSLSFRKDRLQLRKAGGPDKSTHEMFRSLTGEELAVVREWADRVLKDAQSASSNLTDEVLNCFIRLLHKG